MEAVLAPLIIFGTQVIVFQFFATPMFSMVSYKQALATYREWVKQNPEILQKFPQPATWYHYVIGVVLLCVLGYGYVTGQSELFKSIQYTSIAAMLAQNLFIDVLRHKKIVAAIPKPATRSAALLPRTLSAYIPKTLSTLVFGGMILSLALLAYCIGTGSVSAEAIKGISIAMAASYGTGLAVLYYCVKRRPIKADADTSMFYRKSEIGVVFFILSTFVIFNLATLIASFYGFDPVTLKAKGASYIFSLISLGTFLWFLLNPNYRKLASQKFS